MFIFSQNQYLMPTITLEPLNGYNHFQETSMNYFENEMADYGIKLEVFDSARSILGELQRVIWNNSVVKVSTSTNSNYLSGCVTDTFGAQNIERVKSHADIFISDFGYYDVERTFGCIAIDDAWSFNLEKVMRFFKNNGRFYVTSLPKLFGIPFGGLLLSSEHSLKSNLSENKRDILLNHLNCEYQRITKYRKIREENFFTLSESLKSIGFEPFFDLRSSGFPSVGIFRAPEVFNEYRFKELINSWGIRTTSFFGNQGIILPIHHKLTKSELDYIFEATRRTYSSVVGSKT